MILVGSGVVGFVVHRTEHSNAGMAPFGVVPALYPLEYRVGKLGAGLPAPRVEQFELHRPPERLHHRVVVTISDRTHREESSAGRSTDTSTLNRRSTRSGWGSATGSAPVEA